MSSYAMYCRIARFGILHFKEIKYRFSLAQLRSVERFGPALYKAP